MGGARVDQQGHQGRGGGVTQSLLFTACMGHPSRFGVHMMVRHLAPSFSAGSNSGNHTYNIETRLNEARAFPIRTEIISGAYTYMSSLNMRSVVGYPF